MSYFEEYQRRLIDLIGIDEARKLVNNALVLITLGGNDFVNNYFLIPFTPRRLQYNIQDYTSFLIGEYKKILQVKIKYLTAENHMYYKFIIKLHFQYNFDV